MKCTYCNNEMTSLGKPHYEGTDSFEYELCIACEKTFEIRHDCLFGGEPNIEECKFW